MCEGLGQSVRRSGVKNGRPAKIPPACAEAEIDGFVVSIEKQGKAVAGDALTPVADFSDLLAGQAHAEAMSATLIPVGVGHLRAVRLEPVDILDPGAVNRAALEEMFAPKYRLSLAQV